jgi:hypothetical protein
MSTTSNVQALQHPSQPPLMEHDEPCPMQFVASPGSARDFFGSAPQLELENVPYEDNVVTLETDLPDGSVRFKFMPSQGWAELSLAAKPFSGVRLNIADKQ